MYHAYFNLHEEPFGVSPDCRFFYQPPQHGEAVATLYYAIQQRRGFALLVGRAGLGKSTVLAKVMQMLEGEAEIAYLPQPYFDASTVLEAILLALGIEPTASASQNHRLFYRFLLDTRRAGKTCVVMFDEAQDLKRDTLEAIRVLSNFETPGEKLVQIILAGQPRLADTLERPDCEQIRQRLNVIARLAPLTSEEVRSYIEHRLKIAGGDLRLFEQTALAAIVAASGGVPRNVNTICFNSLTLAFAGGTERVGLAEVEEVIRDLDLSLDSAIQALAKVPYAAPVFVPPSRVSFPRGGIVWSAVLVLLAGSTLLFRLSAARDLPFGRANDAPEMIASARNPGTLDSRPFEEGAAPPEQASAAPPVVSPEPGRGREPAKNDTVQAKPAVAPESSRPRAYAVQVGAFRDFTRAESVRDEMESFHTAVRIIHQPEVGGLWHVLVGSEATQESANELSRRLREGSLGTSTFIVSAAPVVRLTGEVGR